MKGTALDIREHYDDLYLTKNAYRQREWLYRPFIDAIVTKAKLRPKSSLMDVGCGQGFFPHLFAINDLEVLGVEISKTAVDSAMADYGTEARFMERDIFIDPLAQFDCVFTRSLTEYNRPHLEDASLATEALLDHVKPGGWLIVDYNTHLGKPWSSAPATVGSGWRNKTPEEFSEHFRPYGGEVYFVCRMDTWLLGSWAFSRPVQWVAKQISRHLGLGGEIVAFVRKPK